MNPAENEAVLFNQTRFFRRKTTMRNLRAGEFDWKQSGKWLCFEETAGISIKFHRKTACETADREGDYEMDRISWPIRRRWDCRETGSGFSFFERERESGVLNLCWIQVVYVIKVKWFFFPSFFYPNFRRYYTSFPFISLNYISAPYLKAKTKAGKLTIFLTTDSDSGRWILVNKFQISIIPVLPLHLYQGGMANSSVLFYELSYHIFVELFGVLIMLISLNSSLRTSTNPNFSII